MLYTGLDYHRSFSYITTMDDKGKIVGQKKSPSNGEVIDFLNYPKLTNQAQCYQFPDDRGVHQAICRAKARHQHQVRNLYWRQKSPQIR